MKTETNAAPLYFARYGMAYPSHLADAAWEPAATLASIQAECIARGQGAELQDVVGFPAGVVHYTGHHVAHKSRYARA